MARSRYEFFKIEQRLLNDPRFFMLSEFEQLTYIKLLSMMKQTKNKIPKKMGGIRLYFRTHRSDIEVKSAINRIKLIFDNFNENKYFYYFDNYEKRYTMLEPQTSQNRGVEEEEEKEKEEEKDKDLKQHSAADAVLKEVNKEFNIYQLLNRLKKELGQPKEFRFPDEIIVNTCLRFLRTRPAIRRVWPWFKESIAQEFMSYNAQKCEAEGKEWKTSPIVRGFEIKAIKEILTIWGKSE